MKGSERRMARTEVKRVVVTRRFVCAYSVFDHAEGLQIGTHAQTYGACGKKDLDCPDCPVDGLDFDIGDALILYSDGTVELIKQEAALHD